MQPMQPMQIQQVLAQARRELPDSETPVLDAEVLLCQVLGCERSYLLTWPERELSVTQQQEFFTLLGRRQAGEPVAYILQRREFWSLELAVDSSTLIPRPDTETLVAAVLALPLPDHARILDLGTGTGAIALALKSERPDWQLTAVDKSPAAVALAQRNSDRLQLPVSISCSDWFSELDACQQFDCILSNPPYIDADDPHLNRGDVRFEPRSALVSEQQGIADIAQIIDQAEIYLAPSGWLIFEHGWQQADAVTKLFIEKGYKKVSTLADYGNVDRVTQAQRPSL